MNRLIEGIASEESTRSTQQSSTFVTKVEVHHGKDFLHYDHRTHQYARVFFRTLKARSEFLRHCEQLKIKTYSNDSSSYYRVVARDYEINLSGWNVLSNYELNQSSSSKAEYVLTVDINDIRSITNEVELANVATTEGFDPSVVRYENMILSSFDIEMIPEKENRFPDADRNPNDSIFMICMTYHFVRQSESLLSVCLTLKESDPLDDVLIVHCQSEACLLAAFARFMRFMQPDFITEFNGGGFDWRNIITKASHCGVISSFLQDMSLVRLRTWETTPARINRFHREVAIKINGATADALCKGLIMEGFVSFDTLIVFKQLEPHADSHRLNECLRRCNLGSKDDMDVKEMFRIYRHGTSAEMRMVAHYCFIDTLKLQQLLLKKNVVQDRREVANLSYTSIHDNFYFAGGIRMRNLLMNRGAKLRYFFDTKYKPDIRDPTAKFPGAYVVPPLKGIAKPMLRYDEFLLSKGITDCDEEEMASAYVFIDKHFDSIYGMNMATQALVPPTERLSEYITFVHSAETHYPVSGLDFASLYPSIIMTYNISPEKLIISEEYAEEVRKQGKNLQFVQFPFCGELVKAWFVRHNNDESEYSICGRLLIELFGRRAAIKNSLKVIGEKIFKMEAEMKEYDALGESYPRQLEYNETKFDYACFDSKQKAVKVFMNTLYGEMGNFLSCICAVQVSASVTTMGKYNLRLAKTFVEDKLQMKTCYGDSVSGDTPILVRFERTEDLMMIEDLVDDAYFKQYDEKEVVHVGDKDISVMTERGFSKVVKVIRHHASKRLFRITTHVGSVVVTEDHSLLRTDGTRISPRQCFLGTRLLHWHMKAPGSGFYLLSEFREDFAFVKGLFFGGGRCGVIKKATGLATPWFVKESQNLVALAVAKHLFNQYYNDVSLYAVNIQNETTAMAEGNVAGLVYEWREEFFTSRNEKKVPQDILFGDINVKQSFYQGFMASVDPSLGRSVVVHGQLAAQGLFMVLSDLGFDVRVSVEVDNDSAYHIDLAEQMPREDLFAVQSIEDWGVQSCYVYDLETQSHHFAAGVGRLVVHNTDSLYVSCAPNHFREYDREYFTGKCNKIDYGTRLVNKTFEQIEIAKQAVNQHLRQDNGSEFLKMAYEEVLFPVAFLSKKKYYGVPHEENVDFYPRKLFLRGLEVVKRGSSDVLKDVINEVLRAVMDIKNTRDIIDIVKDAIKRFFKADWPINAFVKTKVYRPDKNNVSVLTMMRRYKALNYPTIPEPNVRFKYVICKYYPWTYDIQGRQTKNTIGDCMELVERVKDEGLEIDLEYYFDNELTGQFARLITFCHEFIKAVPDLPDIDITGMSEIEIDTLNKERYQRTEDALFKAAKKNISQLAKEYSNAYVNKGSLFMNTWREVCGFISARPDLYICHLNVASALVLRIFANASRGLAETLMNWTTHHIALRYHASLTSGLEGLLTQRLSIVEDLIKSFGLEDILMNCLTRWKRRVVEYIREEFDYDYICKNNIPYNTIWDVLDRQELENILRNDDLFPQLPGDQALAIIDAIAKAIAGTLEVRQMKLQK